MLERSVRYAKHDMGARPHLKTCMPQILKPSFDCVVAASLALIAGAAETLRAEQWQWHGTRSRRPAVARAAAEPAGMRFGG